MPEFPPDSPDDEAVSTALLEQLRAQAGAGLEFVDAPVRFTGGFETFTYGSGCRLRGRLRRCATVFFIPATVLSVTVP